MLWSIDTCQNKVSADQYHMTISWAQFESSSRSAVSFKLTADQLLVSDWIASSSQIKIHFSCAQLGVDAASTSLSKHLSIDACCVRGENGLQKKKKQLFFLHFSAVLIENRFNIYSKRVCERKDHVVWQGFNHAGAVFERCCLLNWPDGSAAKNP